MAPSFMNLFLDKSSANHIAGVASSGKNNCIFAGNAIGKAAEERFMHFVTLKKECFSDNFSQKNLSIFVDPHAALPEWTGVPTEDDLVIEGAKEFCLEFLPDIAHSCGSKIGGIPNFIRSAQAAQFERVLEENNASFILQLDEEDFFLTDEPGIDKAIRDVLCGGALYLFAKIDAEKQLIDFGTCCFDHQI